MAIPAHRQCVRTAMELRRELSARDHRREPSRGLAFSERGPAREALVAAGITAVRSEDCGPCTQLATAMAERRGVAPEVLRAILTDDVAAMPADVALAWRFTKAILAHDPAADDYRAVILERWGPRAVVTLAFAITTARIYPTVKYAMGHGKACTRIVVGGAPVAIDRQVTSNPWDLTSKQSHASRSA